MPGPAALPLIIGGSVVSNALGTAFGNKARKKEARRARAHDINMFDMTNAYNHPSAQMERLRQAGLNPNLVYGGSSGSTAGTASSLPGAKPAPISDVQPGNQIMQYVNLKNTEAQTDNLRTQNGVLSAEKVLKTQQALTEASKQTDLTASAEYKKRLVEKTLQDILESQTKQSKMDAETDNIRKEGEYKNFELKRAKQGQLRGDDYKKVILDMLLSLFQRQNIQF